jgi:hypothetical protein
MISQEGQFVQKYLRKLRLWFDLSRSPCCLLEFEGFCERREVPRTNFSRGRQQSSEQASGLDILASALASVGRRKLLACRAPSTYWPASPRHNFAPAAEQQLPPDSSS